jgi:hypothetical protein
MFCKISKFYLFFTFVNIYRLQFNDISCGENIYAQEIGCHLGMKILPGEGFHELYFLSQGF